ncbi:S-methyl thiohydantoin desulfurase domain-containing protein [Actinokineospora bangkokensis]|uniref:DUF917 domain-containing protein n=1 Tax=Actinokineospora bangkokensis TaxID=1193682 RepID=A0A1Q9LK71_9PSEU|nr:DUF917 family protein [Actinokineospora bangkokensis]OLR92385.1 hypothetical protein BJP25_20065 [Actinokineospora bangkokensis]
MARPDRISADLVDDLTRGAALLAAGGASPAAAAGPLRAALGERGPVPLVAAADLPPEALVVAVGAAGPGPRAGPGADVAARTAVRAVEQRVGARCAAVLPLEIGGASALAAVHAAAVLGVPCVDADGAGRGFGRWDVSLLALAGVAPTPVALAGPGGDLVLISTADPQRARALAAAAADTLGGGAVVATYPVAAARCAAGTVDRSVSGCLDLGARLARDRADRWAGTGIRPLFTGLLADVGGAAGRGTATVLDPGTPGRALRLDFVPTGLILATEDGVPRAGVPDLLCVVDADTGTPLPATRLAQGPRVHVVTAAADRRWRTAVGLAAAGPRAFGYDLDPPGAI